MCTPIASQVKTNTSPGRPKAEGIRQPRNSPPIANHNSDAHERDRPTVDNDILHPHSAPGPAGAGADLRPAADLEELAAACRTRKDRAGCG
jgi:hypothetical protein